MKRLIRLTESELTSIIKRVITETESSEKEEKTEKLSKPNCCHSCNCWEDCGGESYWDGKNGGPIISIEKSESSFKITYEGPVSGYLIKHGKCGSGDSMHQLCNVLTWEINKYLKGKKLKPVLKEIYFKREGKKFTIEVPLQESDKSYKLERRGGMGHDPGANSVKSVYGSRLGFEGPVRHSSGGINEYFVTFYETT